MKATEIREGNLRKERQEARSSQGLRCVRCGTRGYEGDRYCPCCGGAMGRECGECGSLISHPVANYCTKCGAAT